MSSQIKSALDEIVKWTPTHDSDITVAAYDVDAIYTEYSKPFRKLTVIAGPDAANSFVGLGKTIQIEWSIHDIFYYRPIGYADGKKSADEALVDYMVSYIDAARNGYKLTSQTTLTGYEVKPGIFPVGNDSWYGVDCELTITEVYGGA